MKKINKPTEQSTAIVKVKPSTKNKVAVYVADKKETIGGFYDTAAEKELQGRKVTINKLKK